MSESSPLTAAELKAGQQPHQLFLFNMVGNHILMTVIALSNSTLPQLALIIPLVSATIIAITLLKGRSMMNSDSLFIKCHWALAVKRTKVFLLGYVVFAIASAFGAVMYFSMGVMKEMAMAIVGGLGILPVMVLVLVLTVIESESLHLSLNGNIPEGIRKKLAGEAGA